MTEMVLLAEVKFRSDNESRPMRIRLGTTSAGLRSLWFNWFLLAYINKLAESWDP